MTAWDAARVASKRKLRKPYKPVAPVGEKREVSAAERMTNYVQKMYDIAKQNKCKEIYADK
jgi:hypothetical protein